MSSLIQIPISYVYSVWDSLPEKSNSLKNFFLPSGLLDVARRTYTEIVDDISGNADHYVLSLFH